MSLTSLFSINLISADSSGSVHYVEKDHELQDSINQSEDGDIIQINNSINLSTYIIIDKSITLRGVNNNQIIINGFNFGFNISTNNVTLLDLTIQNCSTALMIENNTTTLANISIKNITIQNSMYGMYIQNTTLSKITYVNIINCTLEDYQSVGIYLSNTSYLLIDNNSINETHTAINITNNSNNNTLSNNSFNTNSISINIKSSYNNIIYNNMFINSSAYHAFDDTTNRWNTTTHGNYWDDYTGFKIKDGIIGNTYYNISGGDNQDRKPLGFFAPISDFSFEPSSPTTINTIYFIDNSSNPNNENNPTLYYLWDFGDENTSYKKNPIHNYSINNREYKVTLNVKNQYGQWNKTSRTLIINNSAPTTSFTWSPNPGIVNESIIFNCTSTDPDGYLVNWTWDFGDGTMNYSMNTTHQYNNSGNYTVTLNVTDNDGNSSTHSNTLLITFRPTVDFSFDPAKPTTSDTIQFTDNSSNLDSTIVSWSWDFGDNSNSATQHPTHKYKESGDYIINLSVTNREGATNYTTHEISVANTPPSANFSFNPSNPTTFQIITFTDHRIDPDNIVTNYTWDFGDGTKNYSMNTTTHQYTKSGNYTVTLTITDSNDHTVEQTLNITVRNQPPVASFTYEPLYPEVGETVWFNDTSTDKDGYITNWTWMFQDGSNNYSQNTTYLFSEFKNHNVTLTVVDNDGNASSIKKEIILKKTYTELISSTMISSFDLRSEVNTKIMIKTSNTTNLSVTTYSDIPFGIPETISGYGHLKTYVDISLEDDDVLEWINLSLYYTSEDLTDDINLSSLTLFYWNETSESWVKISDSIPKISDVSGYQGFVQANITHLTLFTIAGTIAEEIETIDPTLPSIVHSSDNTTFTNAHPTLNVTYDGIVAEISASLNDATMSMATLDNKTFTICITTDLSNGNYTLQLHLSNDTRSRTDLIHFSIQLPCTSVQEAQSSFHIPVWVWYSIFVFLAIGFFYWSGMLSHLCTYIFSIFSQKQRKPVANGISGNHTKQSRHLLKNRFSSIQQSMNAFDSMIFGSHDPWKHAQESINHTLYTIDLFTEKPDAYVGIQEKLITEEPTCKNIINLLGDHDESIENIKEKTNLSKEDLSKQLSILIKYGLVEEQGSNMFRLTKQARLLVK